MNVSEDVILAKGENNRFFLQCKADGCSISFILVTASLQLLQFFMGKMDRCTCTTDADDVDFSRMKFFLFVEKNNIFCGLVGTWDSWWWNNIVSLLSFFLQEGVRVTRVQFTKLKIRNDYECLRALI